MRTNVIFSTLGALLLTSAVASAGTVHALDLRGVDRFVSWQAPDPLVQTTINADTITAGWATYAMDFDAAGTTLYVINTLGDPIFELGTVDVGTGAYTAGVTLPDFPTLSTASQPSGMSIDPTDGTFYVATTTELYTLDPVTGLATLVAAFTGTTTGGSPMGSVIDIAIDNNGNLYAHDFTINCLWSVDKTTAVGTFVGFSGLAANYAQGMDFDPEDNQLYAAIYTGGGTGSYGTWDTTTGVWTEIADNQLIPDNSNEFEIAINHIVPPVGTPFCPGDGSLAGCPCGNNSGLGSGEGCLNGGGVGAYLTGSGTPSVAADSLVLTVMQASPNEFGIFVQNITTGAANPFYNGILCLAGDSHLVRHYAPPAIAPTVCDGTGMGTNSQGMTLGDFLGDTAAGVTVHYQFWYRDNTGPCGTGANFSSGYSVPWLP